MKDKTSTAAAIAGAVGSAAIAAALLYVNKRRSKDADDDTHPSRASTAPHFDDTKEKPETD